MTLQDYTNHAVLKVTNKAVQTSKSKLVSNRILSSRLAIAGSLELAAHVDVLEDYLRFRFTIYSYL